MAKKKEIAKGLEVFDDVRTEVRQGKAKHEVAGLDEIVCKKCGNTDAVFVEKNAAEKRCAQCGGTEWHTVKRFEADEVNEVLGRQLVYIALDGQEFDNRLYCEAYNSYLMGNAVETEKCPQCGALYPFKDPKRTKCLNCSCPAEYFKLGVLKKKYILDPASQGIIK